MIAIVDGKEVPATPGAMSELPKFVPGVFETLLWREGEPVFWAQHWSRFAAGCQGSGLTLPMTEAQLAEAARAVARENGLAQGVVRYAAWRETDGQVTWRVEAGPPRPHMTLARWRVGWGPVLPPSLVDPTFKHLSRSAWTDALVAARSAGFDEAILTDQAGRPAEACVGSLFFVRRGTLRTPGVKLGILPGIMRSEVLAVARGLEIPSEEGVFGRGELERASEIWITNSLIGVRPVAELAGRVMPAARPVLDRFRVAWKTRHGWDPVAPVR
ncbi:MAG TPA: aminotransferase class IV [Opitutaceae bacterium]|nr:aminotransferase class IV [Opitutaceae bacterium]